MVALGEFVIEEIPGGLVVTGETTAGVRARGEAVTYPVRGPRGTALTVADIRWANGERDVRTLDRHVSPQTLDRLKQGLRLGVHGHGGRLVVDLAQARLKEGHWSNLYRATWEELDHGAGISVREALSELRADELGTREAVLADASRRRNYLCALFAVGRPLVPIGAYVLTRVAPIVRRVRA